MTEFLTAQDDPCDPPLEASIAASGPVCSGESVTITFNLPEDDDDDESFDVTYSVDGNTFILTGIFNGYTAQHLVTSSTIATLLLVVDNDDDDDECFTEFNQTISITVSDPVLNILSETNPGCDQNNGSITVAPSNGISPYLFSLNGGNLQSSGTFSGLGAGSYTIVVRDAAGCTASVFTTLTSPNAPNLTITNQTNPGCGQTNGSITATASGGVSPYQFSLGGTIYQTSPTFSGLAAGSYQVFVKDAANCIDIETVTLTNPGANLPQASISANTTQGCSATNFTLTGNTPPGTTGLWTSSQVQPSTPANPNWTLSNLTPGSLTATWTLSAPGCPNYSADTLTISVLPPPVANMDGIFNVEQGDFGEANVLLNDVRPASVEVRILKNPAQGAAFLNTQNILEYQPSPTADGLDTATYEICYLDCPDVCDTALVVFRNLRNEDPCVITGDTSYVFTNGLTPNDDGNNDYLVFRVVSVEDCEINYAKSEIIIYNRWGDIVFEALPYGNDWGGKNGNGDDLPPGVYYFVLRITLDKVYSQFGSVILIR